MSGNKEKWNIEHFVHALLKSIVHVEIWMFFFNSCIVLKHRALVIWKWLDHAVIKIIQILAHFIIQLQKLSLIIIASGFIRKIFRYRKAVKSLWYLQIFIIF
jgi:hypothetical protein